MASVDSSASNPNDPNNPNNVPGNVNQPGQQGANQPATSAGGAGPVTATGAGNVTGQVIGTANPSQPFQNISSYLAANAPGGQALAGQVAGTVTAPIAEAQTGITNAAQDFTKSVNAGYTPENKDLTTAVSQNPAYVVAENPENVTNFLAQVNDKYAGPTDFAQAPGYSDIQAKIAAAQAKAANTQDESGIQSLLQSVEGPTTAGINKLDSLLLSAEPANYKTIQDAGTGAANLLPALNDTTAAQNALAATGSTNASTASAAAAKALQDALASETGNLGNQQKTIEGIVNEYNNSVGVINPVTQNIASDIQNFLAANPNLKISNALDALQPLMNLSSIAMPSESTYASPFDYQTIAALAKLGLDPAALAGLPITADTANLAQTFKVPGQLQDAVGKAPGVEAALSGELNTLGGQITGAYQPFQDLTQKEGLRTDLRNQVDTISTQIADVNRQISAASNSGNGVPQALTAKLNDLTAQKNGIMQKASDAGISAGDLYGSYKDAIGQMAQGLQWLDPASKGYNDLITQINAELGKLGSVGVPTLNYAPTTLTDPVSGVPLGTIGKDIGNVAGIAAGAGGAIGAGVGAAESGTAAAAASLAEETGMSLPEAEAAISASSTTGGTAGLGALSALQTAGPAALAAYGTSNIVQNSLKHPIESGLSTLANTGLSLATLSLPPQVFESIGKAINSVLNDIGNWFGGWF
jgi:hypothetical protein